MSSGGMPRAPLHGDAVERFESLAAALAAFFDDLTLTASTATCKTYRSLLRDLDAVESLTPQVCRQLVTERFRTRSPATARTFRAALAAFCAWAVDHHYLIENPILEVPKPKAAKPRHKVLTKPQLRALWNAAGDDTDRLILLLLGQGLRRAEACSLRRSDVRPDGTAQIVGKGGKVRRIVLNEAALLLIGKRKGRVLPVGDYALYERIKAMGSRAGVPWAHPHALRHSWATNWMLETHDMETLRTLGGWSDSSTMPRHYSRLALEESAVTKARAVDLDIFGGKHL